MKIVTAAEMRAIDRITTEKYGVPSLILMENAGAGAARFIVEHWPQAETIVIFCGTGNNGGDGFVAARHLAAAGKKTKVFVLGERQQVKGDASAMLAKLKKPPTFIADAVQLDASLVDADLIIDALLGTGFQPPLKPLYEAAINALNASGKLIVSIDVPSGYVADAWDIEGPLSIEPRAIVTFTAAKPAHVARFGNVPTHAIDIGSPPEAISSSLGLSWITRTDYRDLLAPRRRDAHKGDYGHVLVIGGSIGKSGAAAMAGEAALRVGAGLVTVATARPAQPLVAAHMPELMTEPLPETAEGGISVLAVERARAVLDGKSVVAIGPGLGRHGEALQFARMIVGRSDVPVVLDADGINAFAGHVHELRQRHAPLIMTPHAGEFGRLLGVPAQELRGDRIGHARAFARAHGVTLLLKGHQTIVAPPEGDVWINTTGNPALAKGGSGDILTGMIAGLLAQYPAEPLRAVIAAVNMHGLCGDLLRNAYGDRYGVATDTLPMLPIVMSPAFDPLRIALP